MKLKDKKYSTFIPLYWILQSLCIFTTKGVGVLPAFGGILLIIATIMRNTNNRTIVSISHIFYSLYAIILPVILIFITIMMGVNFILTFLFLVCIFNFYVLYISIRHEI